MLLRSSSKKMKRQMIVKSIIIIKIGSVLQKMTIHRKKWRVLLVQKLAKVRRWSVGSWISSRAITRRNKKLKTMRSF